MAAQVQTNWMPRVLGSMMMRVGRLFLNYTGGGGAGAAKFMPFVKSTDDTALVEINGDAGVMRVWVNDTPIVVPAVTTKIFNGSFSSGLSGWTVNDELGAATTAISGGFQQVGNGVAQAILDQQVSIVGSNIGLTHTLYIQVEKGPITLRIGTALGLDDVFGNATLDEGYHWISFIPTQAVWVRLTSASTIIVKVNDCIMINSGAAATLSLVVPWATADLGNLRWDQSGDVLFVGCKNYQQRRIERRNNNSWSIIRYKTPDGPFALVNTTTLTMTPAALTGNTTLTASRPYFQAATGLADGTRGHVGALFRVASSSGQNVSQSVTSGNTFTLPIKVTGTGASQRTFNIVITGTFTAHVTLQFSVGVPGVWSDSAAPGGTPGWNAPATLTAYDELDNQIIYYRLGVKTGDYVSGTVGVALSIPFGSVNGIGRVTAVNSPTSANIEVLEAFGNTTPSTQWWEGSWSDYRGWPAATVIYEGRLWWAGKGGIFGSVSDAYNSFDDTIVGDAGPINRTIGHGPVDTINWLVGLQRLLLGGQGRENSIRSSALDEILTPTSFNIKQISRQGSTGVPAIELDQRMVFVNRTGIRVYALQFQIQTYDYAPSDLTALCPEVLKPGVVRVDVQRQPDTRIHFVKSDGTAAIMVEDPNEEVLAFINYTAGNGGFIEDVVVLPALAGNLDDQVYYLVRYGITLPQYTNPSLPNFASVFQNNPISAGNALTQTATMNIGAAQGFVGPYVCVVVVLTASVGTSGFGACTSATATSSAGTLTQREVITDTPVSLPQIDFRIFTMFLSAAVANAGFTVVGNWTFTDTHWFGCATCTILDGFGNIQTIFDGGNAQTFTVGAATPYSPSVSTADYGDVILSATWQNDAPAGGGGANRHSTVGSGLNQAYTYQAGSYYPQLGYQYG